MSSPNLFRQLSTEWQRIGASPPARAALGAWAEECSELAGFASPAEVVERCNDRGAGGEAQAILAALLARAAADTWAARTFLQAVLPGLAAISRRYRQLCGQAHGGHGAVWDSMSELDQQVVATAYELMHAAAREPQAWPAEKVVHATRDRVRGYARTELRRRAAQASDAEVRAQVLVSPPPRTVAEELVAALIDAVERGLLTRLDAGMVYSSRVGGRLVEELAPLVGCPERWAYRHRVRAEEVLVEQAFGCGRRRAQALLAAAAS